ncbi:MAG: dihydroneopterin aldolase [Nitrospiraceae bacterium]|nr:dihydroneopterin aldolase [Nitrospiraceae bacterium]|tara:strand:- start:1110 stop:2012 length:903 start_codon:yes stop_codon:yes gene_type:complete
MHGSIIIRDLSINTHCGVTPEERSVAQQLIVNVEATYDTTQAVISDDIYKTVDYERVCQVIKDIARTETFALLETLGNHIINRLFETTDAQTIIITLTKKTLATILGNQGSIGVTTSAQRPDGPQGNRPSALLTEHLALIPPGRALDIATGKGRNALFLAQAGFQVNGVDRNREALAACEEKAKQLGLRDLSLNEIDLEQSPSIENNSYNLIVNTYYLQRNLAPAIVNALRTGGILIFETFLIANHHRFNHPRRKEFCLESNELLSLFRGLTVLYYQENTTGKGPYLARLVATKSSNPVL